jgi:hypothetical protein
MWSPGARRSAERGGRAAALAAGAALALVLGCASAPAGEARYRPAESVLEVVAVLRRHVPDDTYRFEPARDFTGRNVYRASLIRLENLEDAYADALRAGHFDGTIAFAKARALERLRAYDLAAQHHREAAELEPELRDEALRGAALCDALAEAVALDPDAAAARPGAAAETAARFDQREALLEAVLPDVRGSHYEYVVREELERADVARARWLSDTRRASPDGDVRAVAAWQQVILDHRDSKNANRHLLALADLYSSLATAYVEVYPPESLRFDPPTFEELATAATRLYEAVANQDGATERVEAARRLEAFVAFTLRVDRDRFSQ